MEGRYAAANRNYTTALWKKFLQAYPIKHELGSREQGAEVFRYSVFINCWYMNKVENMKMWETFGKHERSVVIVSTVGKLVAALADQSVQPGRVKYASQAVPRPEWSHYGPFFFKDTQFMPEREFRLVTHPPEDTPVQLDTMLAVTLPIEPSAVIDLVKVHPNSPPAFKEEVKTFLKAQNTRLPVSKSSESRGTKWGQVSKINYTQTGI